MSEQVVIIAVDDASIQALGRWPWSRRRHAQLLDRLTAMDVRAVGIDMLFSETQSDDPQADVIFAQALARNDRTVLPVAPIQITPLDPISEMLPIPELASAAKALGHVDVELDIDGLCRQFFLYAGIGDAHWSAFTLAMLHVGGDTPEADVNRTPVMNNSSVWLRQNRMLVPYAQYSDRPRLLSYVDVLEGRAAKSDLYDKYVLVGATATGLGDVISTPASAAHERMPGVELNAHIISGLLQNINIYELAQQYRITLTIILIILSAIIFLMLPLRFGFIAMLLSIMFVFATSIILLTVWHLWFPPVVTLLMIAMLWPLWSIWQLGIENRLRQKLLVRLEKQALYHMATGLPNHYMLENHLRSLSKNNLSSSKVTALMVLHINWPGSAGVVLGRSVGDDILKAIGERLRAVATAESFVAHLNGDDFAVLFTELENSAAVKKAADDLLVQLQQPLKMEQRQFLLVPQIGVSISSDNNNALKLLRNAYSAMFKSRIDDTEHLCFYSANIGQQLKLRSELEQALIHALERDEFEVYYQPQINAKTGQIAGVEALLRWQNPLLGWITPESFIPIAEHVGLIKDIGEWVLETACRQLQNWHNAGLGPLRLAVNVSPLQFIATGLPSNIRSIVEQAGMSPGELELEITESSLMQDLDAAVKVMRQIKQEGMELAIDDFGTGYSSLSSLRHFPLDRLKIDQSFTREIGKNNNATEITLTILAMGKRLGLEIIAEGVETIEQAEFLREHGCDEFQGFLFSKPLSAKDLTLLLKKGLNLAIN